MGGPGTIEVIAPPHTRVNTPKCLGSCLGHSADRGAPWRGPCTIELPNPPHKAADTPDSFRSCLGRLGIETARGAAIYSWLSKSSPHSGGYTRVPPILLPPSSTNVLCCIRVCMERRRKCNHTRAPNRASLSPKRPKQESEALGRIRRCMGRGLKFNHTLPPPPPRGLSIPQTAPVGPQGLGCIRRCIGTTCNFNCTYPFTGRPYPRNGPGGAGATRVYPPLCGEDLEVQSHPTPPEGRPYLRNGPNKTGGTRMYLPPCRDELEVQSQMAPAGGVPIPKGPGQDRRDSGVSAAMWGGTRSSITPHPPTGRPYPPNGSGRTGQTWVYLQLCGKELEARFYMAPPTGRPYPQAAQAELEVLGCIRVCREELEVQSYRPPPPWRPYPPNGPCRTGGSRVNSSLSGAAPELQSYMAPPRASLSPKRPSALTWAPAP